MWCISDNIINMIEEKIIEKEIFDKNQHIQDNIIYECKLCGLGFKDSENTDNNLDNENQITDNQGNLENDLENN